MPFQSKLSDVVIVITTEADRNNANKLSELILKKRLAACISFQQISSVYWWEDQLERNDEVQLMIKTTLCKIEELKDCICQNHSYDTPEFIHFPINASNDYKLWLNKVTFSDKKIVIN